MPEVFQRSEYQLPAVRVELLRLRMYTWMGKLPAISKFYDAAANMVFSNNRASWSIS